MTEPRTITWFPYVDVDIRDQDVDWRVGHAGAGLRPVVEGGGL